MLEAVWQSFTDKILLVVTPNGKIGQLMSVSLRGGPTDALAMPVSYHGEEEEEAMEMLPDVSLTPRFLMGASSDRRGEMASTVAVQVASLLRRLAPNDDRTLVLGLTLPGSSRFWDDESGRHDEIKSTLFTQIIEIVSKVRM